MPRIPSDRNPFKMPDELRGFPVLFRALIRPIREADARQGKDFVKRFLTGPQEVYEDIADAVASVWDVLDPELCPDDLLQYLKDLVGFDKDFDYITDRLSFEDLRKLIKLAVPLWKERFSGIGIVNLIRLLTGRNAIIYDWFHYRAIIGETFLSEEQLGYDFWIIGGDPSYQGEFWMQVRLMDDGTVDELLVLDLLELERVSSERIEVALVDFLDQFDLDRDKWETLAGTPASVEIDKTFKIPTGTSERALLACETFTDYAVLQRFYLPTAGAILDSYFFVQDWVAGNYYRVQVEKDSIELATYVGGSPTVLGSASFPGTLAFPIFTGLWYKLRVTAVAEGGSTRVKVYVDGNEVFNVLDGVGINYGEVVLGAEGADHVFVDNVEIFRVPLRLATIEPSGTTQSANFIWDKVCPAPPPPPPAALLVYGKFNGSTLDTDVVVINACDWEQGASFRQMIDYVRDGEYEYGDDFGGAALVTSGQKFGRGCLDLTGAGAKQYTYRDFGGKGHDVLTDRRIGTISAWVKPDYSGTPGSSVGFFGWSNPSFGSGAYNKIPIYHDAASGKLSASFWDGSTNLIGTIQTASAWSPTSGVWYHIELGFDLLNGNQYLFVDGVLVATGTLTGTRSVTGTNYLTIGGFTSVPAPQGGPHVADHYVDDIVIFDSVRHTGGFVPPTTSFLDVIESTQRLYYTSAGGSTLGAPRDGIPLTDIVIDNVNQKVGSGCMNFAVNTNESHLRFVGDDIVDALGDEGTISFWVRVEDATPADDNVFVEIQDNAHASTSLNRITIYLESSGNLHIQIRGSTGTSIVNFSQAWNPTPGTWYNIEAAWILNQFYIFVDGVSLFSGTGSGIRAAGAKCLTVGNFANGGSNFTESRIDDLRIYDAVQHTTNFTPDTDELVFLP